MESESTPGLLVSVIVPVHNAGQYLSQCLASLLGQSLKALEVIAVDDASTDGSAETLAAIAAGDDRLRVITLERNVGVSAARNLGMAAAGGDFVAFVDADDYVDVAMYETLLAAAKEHKAEVVSCGIKVVDADGRTLEVVDFPLKPGVRHEQDAVRESLHRAFAAKLLWYPVRSLYARRLIADHRLRFDEGIRKGEDSLFNLQALLFADGVACIRAAPYHYRKHSSSATARPLASESANIENLTHAVLRFHADQGFGDRARRDFFRHLLRSDLPTALVRLASHPQPRAQVRALVDSEAVREAFRTQPLRGLDGPLRVAVVLALSKRRAVCPLMVVIRTLALLRRGVGRRGSAD